LNKRIHVSEPLFIERVTKYLSLSITFYFAVVIYDEAISIEAAFKDGILKSLKRKRNTFKETNA
jgi:hypothetical protein